MANPRESVDLEMYGIPLTVYGELSFGSLSIDRVELRTDATDISPLLSQSDMIALDRAANKRLASQEAESHYEYDEAA